MARRDALSRDDAIDKVWTLAERIGICMFITWDGERQRARPVVARVHREDHAIYFLTDEHGAKDDQIRQFPIVSLAFSDTQANDYVAITGRAEVSNDRARISELFSSAFDKPWWDSEDDPAIRLITFSPEDAEVWTGKGRLRTGVALIVAAISGSQPNLGVNTKVGNL